MHEYLEMILRLFFNRLYFFVLSLQENWDESFQVPILLQQLILVWHLLKLMNHH